MAQTGCPEKSQPQLEFACLGVRVVAKGSLAVIVAAILIAALLALGMVRIS